MDNNSWTLVGKDTKGNKIRKKRQIIVFLIVLVLISITILINYFMIIKYDTNLYIELNKYIEKVKFEKEKELEVVEDSENEQLTISQDESTLDITKENQKENILKDHIYQIINKSATSSDGLTLILYEIKNYNGKTLLEYSLDGIKTEPSYGYKIKVTNEEGKIVSTDENEVYSGEIELVEDIYLDETLTVNVQEILTIDENEKTTRKIELAVDLKNSIEHLNLDDYSKTFTRWNDLTFEIYTDNKENKNVDNNLNISSYNTSFNFGKEEYSHTLFNISMVCNKNIENLKSIDEVCEKIELIKKFGFDLLNENYTLYTINNNTFEILGEVQVSYEELSKLDKGESIVIDGKKYVATDFDSYYKDFKFDKSENIKIDGIDAKKIYDSYENTMSYLILYKDNIYKISTQNDIDDVQEINKLINSIKFN